MPDHAWVDLIGMARSTDERSRTAQPAPGRLDRAVADARAGDAAAFRLLYREFQPPLLRYLRFLVGDGADDVADEAWQRAAAGLGTRRGGLSLFRHDYAWFRGWIAGLARAIAHEDLTRTRPVPPAGPMPGAGQQDATDAALRMIAELPPEEAEAVLLRSVLGLDARRAARVCGQRPRALRAAARRGLSTLAGRL